LEARQRLGGDAEAVWYLSDIFAVTYIIDVVSFAGEGNVYIVIFRCTVLLKMADNTVF
jgi:hypothetical protein